MLAAAVAIYVCISPCCRYYPTHKKAWKARRATAVIVSMVLVVVACIAAVYAFRYAYMYADSLCRHAAKWDTIGDAKGLTHM